MRGRPLFCKARCSCVSAKGELSTTTRFVQSAEALSRLSKNFCVGSYSTKIRPARFMLFALRQSFRPSLTLFCPVRAHRYSEFPLNAVELPVHEHEARKIHRR